MSRSFEKMFVERVEGKCYGTPPECVQGVWLGGVVGELSLSKYRIRMNCRGNTPLESYQKAKREG